MAEVQPHRLPFLDGVLTAEQVARLDAASERTAPYPYFPYRRQEAFARLNPPAV